MKTMTTSRAHDTKLSITRNGFADEIPAGTLHAADEIQPGTLHAADELPAGTLHAADEIQPGTLHNI